VRYVVVGYGNVGAKRKTALGARCVATVDPFNAAADYRTVEQCPGDAYDAAIVATPNGAKLELLRHFVERGKHVLVEKPLLFSDDAEGAQLAEAARARGVIWYTGYNFRFEPNVVALKRHLEAGDIGPLYHARMFYGNGTAANVAGSWHDTPLGVIEDLACHLVDLTGYVFGRPGAEFVVWERRAHETKGPDHCVLATADRSIEIEVSLLSWKNRWHIEVTGAGGSMEMDGLTKWGTSELILRRRRLPSGPPAETRETASPPDPTWAAELEHFERCARERRGSFDNDRWISRVIHGALAARLA